MCSSELCPQNCACRTKQVVWPELGLRGLGMRPGMQPYSCIPHPHSYLGLPARPPLPSSTLCPPRTAPNDDKGGGRAKTQASSRGKAPLHCLPPAPRALRPPTLPNGKKTTVYGMVTKLLGWHKGLALAHFYFSLSMSFYSEKG